MDCILTANAIRIRFLPFVCGKLASIFSSDSLQSRSMALFLFRNGKDENLIGNTFSCKRLEMLQVGFAKGMPTGEYLREPGRNADNPCF